LFIPLYAVVLLYVTGALRGVVTILWRHGYTVDQAILIDLVLEKLSLLFQEYTVEPAARLVRVAFLMAYLPRDEIHIIFEDDDFSSSSRLQLFGNDASGLAVAFEENYAVINWEVSSNLESKLKELVMTRSDDNDDDATIDRQSLDRQLLFQILQEETMAKSSKRKTQH
jgi:hypothetical protein